MADFEQTLNVASGKNSFTTLIISDPTNSIIKTSADSDWITVENPQWTGSTASSVFTITENTGTTVRTGRVYISATTIEDSEYEGTVTKALEGTIVQKEGLSYYVKSSISSSSVVSAATSVTITISANTSWTISSDSSWATLYKTSGSGNASIKVTISANSSTSSRSATFTITSSTCTPSPASLSVTQEAWSKPTIHISCTLEDGGYGSRLTASQPVTSNISGVIKGIAGSYTPQYAAYISNGETSGSEIWFTEQMESTSVISVSPTEDANNKYVY